MSSKSKRSIDPKDRIRITKVTTTIEKRPIRVQEHKEAVQILHPPFRASCEFEICPEDDDDDDNDDFSIGFVQFVKSRRCCLDYTSGRACWEFNGFKTHDVVLDADGSAMPFYGGNKEVVNVHGGGARRNYRIEMVDQPSIKSSWKLELYASGLSVDSDSTKRLCPRLKSIMRNQRFVTCVVLHDHVTDRFTVLRAYEWSLKLAVAIDATQQIGARARVVSTAKDLYAQPRRRKGASMRRFAELLDSRPGDSPLLDVTANDSDTLVWRHKYCLRPVTIVKSKTICDDLGTSTNQIKSPTPPILGSRYVPVSITRE